VWADHLECLCSHGEKWDSAKHKFAFKTDKNNGSPLNAEGAFRALGQLVEASGAQVVFSSIPSVAGKSTERGRKTHLINRWLRDWCHQWNFGFFDHGEVYMALGLLVADKVQLSQRAKSIRAHELVGLIERALN